jgi:hypothetical protein
MQTLAKTLHVVLQKQPNVLRIWHRVQTGNAALEALKSSGALVTFVKCDLSSAEESAAALERGARYGPPSPVFFHAGAKKLHLGIAQRLIDRQNRGSWFTMSLGSLPGPYCERFLWRMVCKTFARRLA